MGCKCSPSLRKLLDDATKRWPDRSRASDGCCGDKAHAARKSDHNPANGYAHAADLTHDPAHGVDCLTLSRQVINDSRVTYVIWNGHIFKRYKPDLGWAKYTGVNRHDHHMHVSIRLDATFDLSPWPWSPEKEVAGLYNLPVLRPGDSGQSVASLQRRLVAHGEKLEADGHFGPATESAVKAFQSWRGIKPDGVVGPLTWMGLLREPE